ncbi:MAG TPA: tRNA uridine-5-carboxymethylaminomethyl(34) synthesis GTPase MnmE, partial [Gammaproteobacteria bacterium]|nr:tRNA uridine-5-carboxymethylaminomethyl(34) synthesis GTPase MnmE [Gammaproteobacteria bacterium]
MADTIVACATPPGRGGVSVVRLSGPEATAIGKALATTLGPPRQAVLRDLVANDQQIIDSALVIFFPAPNSFTGEDVVELQCHGSPLVVDALINATLLQGARVAQPGEFSRRAFLNDRIDLLQAEAIADLIDATSQQAVIGAQRSLKG